MKNVHFHFSFLLSLIEVTEESVDFDIFLQKNEERYQKTLEVFIKNNIVSYQMVLLYSFYHSHSEFQ